MAWYEVPDGAAAALRAAAKRTLRRSPERAGTPGMVNIQAGLDALQRPFPSRPLDQIHELLDGHEWDSDTTVAIADIVRSTGRRVRPPVS